MLGFPCESRHPSLEPLLRSFSGVSSPSGKSRSSGRFHRVGFFGGAKGSICGCWRPRLLAMALMALFDWEARERQSVDWRICSVLGEVVIGSPPQQTKSTKCAESCVATSPPVCLLLFDLHGKEVYPEHHSVHKPSHTVWGKAGKHWLLDQLCKSWSRGSWHYPCDTLKASQISVVAGLTGIQTYITVIFDLASISPPNLNWLRFTPFPSRLE